MNVAVVVAPRASAVRVYVVLALATVGVPVISPVFQFKIRPSGRLGETENTGFGVIPLPEPLAVAYCKSLAPMVSAWPMCTSSLLSITIDPNIPPTPVSKVVRTQLPLEFVKYSKSLLLPPLLWLLMCTSSFESIATAKYIALRLLATWEEVQLPRFPTEM